MSTKRLLKHNPSFLTPEELTESFVVRQPELARLLRVVRENTGPVNQHLVVLGSRGMGKTMLVRRCALAVRKDQELSRDWYPILFPEELYSVSSEGEFWLSAIKVLADQEEDDLLRARHRALLLERDEMRLRAQALATLSEFSRTHSQRLLVVVENMQMLWGEQASAENAWNLRHTLSNEPAIMLLATATGRFGEISGSDRANYELFREVPLDRLSSADCATLWRSITRDELEDWQVRPMEILTGGSPRLLAILADFAAGRSLADLLENLVILIDDHTTYFKANVEALAAQERRVYVTLAEIWQPAAAREVALAARISVNICSSLLKRLVSRGAVQEVGHKGRAVLYQVSERLYNIYHLLRLSGSDADRVKAVVRLLVPIYGGQKVPEALSCEALSLCRLGRIDEAIEVCRDVLNRYGDGETSPLRDEAVKAPIGVSWAIFSERDPGRAEAALELAEMGLRLAPKQPNAQGAKAAALALLGRWSEALAEAAMFVNNPEVFADCPRWVLDFFSFAAHEGQAPAALVALSGTLVEKKMEPLIVALKMAAGVEYNAPQEVEEMARDIIRMTHEKDA